MLGFSFEVLEFFSACMDQSTSGLANMNIPSSRIEIPMPITIVAPHRSLDLLSITALKIFSVHVIFNIIKIKRESYSQNISLLYINRLCRIQALVHL